MMKKKSKDDKMWIEKEKFILDKNERNTLKSPTVYLFVWEQTQFYCFVSFYSLFFFILLAVVITATLLFVCTNIHRIKTIDTCKCVLEWIT